MALFIILLPIAILVIFLLRQNSKLKNFPPGPKGLPIIGNLHQLDNSKIHQNLYDLSKIYGPLFSLQLGFVPTIVISSAKLAEQVMKTQDLDFCSRPPLLGQQTLSYNGLDLAFAPYNEYYKEMRKICVVHLFSPTRVQQFRPIREDEVRRMVEKISNSKTGCVNLNEVMMSLTSSSICRVAFGKRYDDDESDRSRFHSLLSETQAMFMSFFFSDYFPLVGWIDRLTGLKSRLRKNFEDLDKFYEELINERLNENKRENEKEDILDVLLQLIRQPELFKMELTLNHIKGILMNIIVAGTDTSAANVVWAMAYLMKNLKVMKKAQDEVRNLVGNKGFVDEDDIQNLPYLQATIKETMRLQPVTPLLVPRETTRKCTLNGYDIPAKTMVYTNVWTIGRDPEAWDNFEEFNPDRFIGSSIDMKGQHYELTPFGAGRRVCPGLHIGIMTVEVSLANLIYRFDWRLPDGMTREDLKFDALPGITMHMKNPLCLVASKYV